MGFMEKKAQQEMLKRAMDTSWAASCCIGMVFGPLAAAVEQGNPNRTTVNSLIDDWLAAWRTVRQLSDRNLHRNRDWYAIQPNKVLSPILLEFEQRLESVRALPGSDGQATILGVKEAYLATAQELLEFNEWAKSVGPEIDFDAKKYEDHAARQAQRYWEPTARKLAEMMG
jgi:hypothetical protein